MQYPFVNVDFWIPTFLQDFHGDTSSWKVLRACSASRNFISRQSFLHHFIAASFDLAKAHSPLIISTVRKLKIRKEPDFIHVKFSTWIGRKVEKVRGTVGGGWKTDERNC